MKRIMMLLCAAALLCATMTGCLQKAADDASEAASSAMSDIEDRADEYGTVNDGDGRIEENTNAVVPTIADMDQMIENGKIDDENDDDYDGDNIDDDQQPDGSPDEDSGEDVADGGDHNDETMNDGDSSFI